MESDNYMKSANYPTLLKRQLLQNKVDESNSPETETNRIKNDIIAFKWISKI